MYIYKYIYAYVYVYIYIYTKLAPKVLATLFLFNLKFEFFNVDINLYTTKYMFIKM